MEGAYISKRGGETGGETTDHAELDIRLAVSTVPPRTTSFMPSTTELPATLPTRGWTRLLSASICQGSRERMTEMMGFGVKRAEEKKDGEEALKGKGD